MGKKSEEESRRPSITSVTSIRMGNGSSSSSSQQQRNEEFADHDYEEVEERDLRRKEKFQRNHSIVTLDIKPGEWERFAEVQRSQQEQTAGRDMWWGEDQQSSRPGQHRGVKEVGTFPGLAGETRVHGPPTSAVSLS